MLRSGCVVAGFCSVLLLTFVASVLSTIANSVGSQFCNWFAFVLLIIVATIAVCYVTLFSEACSEFFSDHGKLWVCSLVVFGAVLLFSMGLLPLIAGVLSTVDAASTPTIPDEEKKQIALKAVTAFLDYVTVALAVATVLSFWCCPDDDVADYS